MATLELGFHCSHEQHAPSALLQYVRTAAGAGFTHAMCSDHVAPWIPAQGHAGYTWSWLGAAMQSTAMSFGTVCAPGQRYHPVIVAQAAATLAAMYEGRFWLAVGSGEALNESITGLPWPAKPDRNARLEECVRIMRALWEGDTVTHHGHVTVSQARLYDRPAAPPMIVGAALSPETARWMGSWADALITVAGPRERMRQVVDAFRDGGGTGKPLLLQVALSYAPSDREAEAAAVAQWPQAALRPDQLADLETPEAFARATAGVDAKTLFASVRCSSDIMRHAEWLREDAALGFSRIYLHNVAREHQARFIDACGARLFDALRLERVG